MKRAVADGVVMDTKDGTPDMIFSQGLPYVLDGYGYVGYMVDQGAYVPETETAVTSQMPGLNDGRRRHRTGQTGRMRRTGLTCPPAAPVPAKVDRFLGQRVLVRIWPTRPQLLTLSFNLL